MMRVDHTHFPLSHLLTAPGFFLPQETKGSVAVRVALGETQLVQEVRSFLIDNGVCLDSFSQVSPSLHVVATTEPGKGFPGGRLWRCAWILWVRGA